MKGCILFDLNAAFCGKNPRVRFWAETFQPFVARCLYNLGCKPFDNKIQEYQAFNRKYPIRATDMDDVTITLFYFRQFVNLSALQKHSGRGSNQLLRIPCLRLCVRACVRACARAGCAVSARCRRRWEAQSACSRRAQTHDAANLDWKREGNDASSPRCSCVPNVGDIVAAALSW